MQTILNNRNCHRAATVRQINNPEYGEWKWEWRGQILRNGFLYTEYAHVASKDGFGNAIVVADNATEMGLWEVTSWKYEHNLEGLWDKAVRAFGNTSFHPEVRAAQYIRDYEQLLIDDLKNLPTEEHENYVTGFTNWVEILFDKHSRILSVMITGPARFPTARNEKANNAYDKAVDDFNEWRNKFAKNAAKRAEANKTPEQRSNEEWTALKKEIDSCLKTCAKIDNGTSPYIRSAFTTSVYNKLERLAKHGKTELINKALEYIKTEQANENNNLRKPLFTDRHKIWNLQVLCDTSIAEQEQRSNKQEVEIPFKGGVVVLNYAEDRLQIRHEQKPSADVIARLKHNAFKWSRFNGCWQRQLTQNAYYGAARALFGEDIHNEERSALLTQIINAQKTA